MKKKEKKAGKSAKAGKVKVTPALGSEVIVFLNHLAHKSVSIKQLIQHFKIRSKYHQAEFEALLEGLTAQGLIARTGKRHYQSVEGPSMYQGIVDFVNPKYAFVVVDGLEDDIRVSTENMMRALDGDLVKVSLIGNSRRKPEGRITEIIDRRKKSFVGRLDILTNFAFVIPDDRKMHYDIFVSKDAIQNANNGDKVIVELVGWKDKDKNPVGIIKHVLGKSGDHETEIHAIMFEYGLPFKFPETVEAEAEKIPEEITEADRAARRDFREVTTFTIDPLTAKDFDDAISLQKVENDNWEIGVHIADVTHYVRPDTMLEKEALQRATSVYLVDRTVPMLPEKLSNNLCSLRPKEEKLSFSAVFTLSPEGNVLKEWFGRTIIFSDRRFTYEEAQERLETGQGDFAQELTILNDLAKKMREERYAKGAISFESVEFYFRLGDNGEPLELIPKQRKDAHKLVEEFMLLANKKVAEFVFRKQNSGVRKTMVYRVHEDPDPDKVEVFTRFAAKFGFKILTGKKSLPHSLNNLAKELEGKPQQAVLESQAIRTMAKAKYTTEPIGHYGLAFAHYTHFTSPIRRYPDMMVHRLLQHYLDGGAAADKNEFEVKCRHSSAMEKRATDAERASIKYKQVEFMQRFVGHDMDGFISGVTEWGIYVEVEETKCEGMVRLSSMQDDYYFYDEENLRVVGKRYQQTYEIGDRVRVTIKSTNLDKRTIDMEMLP